MKTFWIAAGLAVGLVSAAAPVAANAAPAPQRDWRHDDGRHDNGRHNGWDRGRHEGWDRGWGHDHGRHNGWYKDRGWRGHRYGPRCHYAYHHRRVCYR